MNKITFFIGTYASYNEKSIFSYTLDTNTLDITENFSVQGFQAPSYLAIDKVNNRLFAVEETVFPDSDIGASVAMLDLGTMEKSPSHKVNGEYPCHILYDNAREMVYVSNYGTGSVSTFTTSPSPTQLTLADITTISGNSIDPERQTSAHTHYTCLDVNDYSLWAVDLGVDKIKNYSVISNKLSANIDKDITVTAGCGPRHIVFGKHEHNTDYMYVACELSNEILVFNTQTKQLLQQISTLMDKSIASSCAAIKLSPDGNYLFVSNRGDDSIAHYKILDNGLLKLIDIIPCMGKSPRDIAVCDNIILVANQHSDTITIFTKQGEKWLFSGKEIHCPQPSCICI